MEDYLDALENEMQQKAELIRNRAVKTLYIGGGTPTMLPHRLFSRLLKMVVKQIRPASGTEMTVEANPGTLDLDQLTLMADLGFNRISLGFQSTHDHLLQTLGRIHTWSDCLHTVGLLSKVSWVNWNADLMYGLPDQTLSLWEQSVLDVAALAPTHVSAYSLVIEDGTVFGQLQSRGQLMLPDEDTEADMFESGKQVLETCGLNQYEISNYAKPGCQSQHNLVYWHNQAYLGMGAGAFSYLDRVRSSNFFLPQNYIAGVMSGSATGWKEHVTVIEEMEETMMMGMRLVDGVDFQLFADRFGVELMDVFHANIRRLQEDGLVEVSQQGVRPTLMGIRFNNRIGREFIQHNR